MSLSFSQTTNADYTPRLPPTNVPQGISFYEAHHKLDALAAGLDLLKTDEDRFFLLDCDIVALRRFDDEQLAMIQHAGLIVYDISDQVFSTYGRQAHQTGPPAVRAIHQTKGRIGETDGCKTKHQAENTLRDISKRHAQRRFVLNNLQDAPLSIFAAVAKDGHCK
jgi:hypothetical protein